MMAVGTRGTTSCSRERRDGYGETRGNVGGAGGVCSGMRECVACPCVATSFVTNALTLKSQLRCPGHPLTPTRCSLVAPPLPSPQQRHPAPGPLPAPCPPGGGHAGGVPAARLGPGRGDQGRPQARHRGREHFCAAAAHHRGVRAQRWLPLRNHAVHVRPGPHGAVQPVGQQRGGVPVRGGGGGARRGGVARARAQPRARAAWVGWSVEGGWGCLEAAS